MTKCGAKRCDTKKTYYNDQHQSTQVIEYRNGYLSYVFKKHLRMRVWKFLSETEEQKYLERRSLSPFSDAMAVGERFVINNEVKFIHHMDDQEGWQTNPVLHPSFTLGPKPIETNWKCDEGHEYDCCLCHCELREYGQDESIYRSGDHPSSRWGVDGRSYPISKSQCISKMVSAFKEYSKHGFGLSMSTGELITVNAARVGTFYHDKTPMLPLLESPGLRIINPTKAGDGYWNYEKMAY